MLVAAQLPFFQTYSHSHLALSPSSQSLLFRRNTGRPVHHRRGGGRHLHHHCPLAREQALLPHPVPPSQLQARHQAAHTCPGKTQGSLQVRLRQEKKGARARARNWAACQELNWKVDRVPSVLARAMFMPKIAFWKNKHWRIQYKIPPPPCWSSAYFDAMVLFS